MKNMLISVIATLLLIPSMNALAQERTKLDSAFKYNFVVLDSVANGMKKQQKLNTKQVAFLYIINGWSDHQSEFNHNNGFNIKGTDLKKWRHWYAKHAKEISLDDFLHSMEKHVKFFVEGVAPERDLEYMESLNKKYRNLK